MSLLSSGKGSTDLCAISTGRCQYGTTPRAPPEPEELVLELDAADAASAIGSADHADQSQEPTYIDNVYCLRAQEIASLRVERHLPYRPVARVGTCALGQLARNLGSFGGGKTDAGWRISLRAQDRSGRNQAADG